MRAPAGWRSLAFKAKLARAGVFTLVLAALFVTFYRLGTASWYSDEVGYRNAGLAYVHGHFEANLEHPPLAKYILGVTQLLVGRGPAAVRAPAALAGLVTGVVLFLLARRLIGFGAGVLAFAFWTLLPHAGVLSGADVLPVKIERFALLDVFMGLFTTVSLYGGWRWAEGGRWRWAVAAGMSAGLATACKAPGVLVLPAVLLTAIVTRRGSSRVLGQAAAVVALCALTALAAYAPLLGDAPHAIRTVYEFQQARNAGTGHPIEVAGHVYVHPPWWSLLWFQWKGVGAVATIAMGLAVVAAPFVLPRWVALYLLAAVLVPVVYLSTFLGFALPHYYYAWMPALTLLVAAALYALLRAGRFARVGAVVALCALAGSGIATGLDVARLHTADYAAAAKQIKAAHSDDGYIAVWQFPATMAAYLPNAQVGSTPIPSRVSGVVVDPVLTKRFTNSALAAYLRGARGEFTVRRVDRLTLYLKRPPRLSQGETLPAAGSVGNNRALKVRIGARSGHLALRRASDGHVVAGNSYRQGNAIVFDPQAPLAGGTRYSARFSGPPGSRTWSFTTAHSIIASPSRLSVSSGTLRAGSAPVLRSPDGAVVIVRSTGNPGPTAALVAVFRGVRASANDLVVGYVGRSSRRCLQNLGLWSWRRRSWIQLHSGIMDPAGRHLVKTPGRGDLATYVRRGEVRIRVLCQREDAGFALVADALRLHYEGP